MTSSIGELLNTAADQRPNKVAVEFGDASLTYMELLLRAESLARNLVQVGVKRGTPVGLAVPKSMDAIVAIYGILLCGASYVPIDVNSSSERASRIVENTDLHVLVCHQKFIQTNSTAFQESGRELKVFVPDLTEQSHVGGFSFHGWFSNAGSSEVLPKVSRNDIAYILHTSGSTGTPKGVAISHNSALTFVEMAAEFFEITAQDKLCCQAPFHFDLSVFDVFVACRSQASLVIFPEFFNAFPAKMIEAIEDCKITIWNSVVSTLTQILGQKSSLSERLDSVRVVLFSGEAMSIPYLKLLREKFRRARLFNGYGQTEANTSMRFEVVTVPEDDEWRLPIGTAFPDYDVFALDDNGSLVKDSGIIGELYVCSDAVADGYWNDPELSASKFVDDPRSNDGTKRRTFRTGDLVLLDEDRQYHFVGRKDNMIKSRGYRVELGEIEHALMSHEDIVASACVAVPDESIGNRVEAFVCLEDDSTVDEKSILSHCQKLLPNYMLPAHISILSSFPVTSTGKVDRQALLSARSGMPTA